jgi:squalene-hopene/tetraprenyl-beta-curcumene cyclase
MKRTQSIAIAVTLLVCVAGIAGGIVLHSLLKPPPVAYRANWSPAAAAAYLDQRETWWQKWPEAQREQGTECVSCHTVLPYAWTRPMLRAQLGQPQQTAIETAMLQSIEKRVNDWQQIGPWYPDPAHAQPSRATESVMNAVILQAYSTAQPQDPIAAISRRASDQAWALQLTSGDDAGGWLWQDFHEAPWESPESAYSGAAWMALAVGGAPAGYDNDPSYQAHVQSLRGYLQRHYDTQPPLNQLYVLWASAKMPGLLTNAQRTDLVQRVDALQLSDGGWSLAALDKQTRVKPAFLDMLKKANSGDGSDGIATGLAVLALEETGGAQDPAVKRGLAWLNHSQNQQGNWWASSLNGFRDPHSDMGLFMSDAATGYAILALDNAQNPASAATAASKEPIRRPANLHRSSVRTASVPPSWLPM